MFKVGENNLHIAILLTCFNRRAVTLECLKGVFESDLRGIDFDFFIVDGGSSDGTVKAISERHPDLHIEVHNGLFWNQGMIQAWKLASREGFDYDAYLLLNDDVNLRCDAIRELAEIIKFWEGHKLGVGYTVSPSTGLVSYGGLKRKIGMSKIRFELVSDHDDQIITMNGNCVLVPRLIYKSIGILDSRYQHSFGDIDYGLRATKAGFGIALTKSPVANLESNKTLYSGTQKIGLGEIYQTMKNPKGLPIGEWLYFTMQHAGFLWPINFVVKYFKMVFRT